MELAEKINVQVQYCAATKYRMEAGTQSGLRAYIFLCEAAVEKDRTRDQTQCIPYWTFGLISCIWSIRQKQMLMWNNS